MFKKRYSLTVRGQNHEWSFTIEALPAHVEDWRTDGLIVDELLNTIPEWVVRARLLRPWIFLQDLFYLHHPWK